MSHLKRLVVLFLLALPATLASAQKAPFAIRTLTLPKELADKNNQFSGLYLRGTQLLLLSESRLQERAEAKVYAVDLASVEQQLSDKAKELTYKKYAIQGLDSVRARIGRAGQVYEGLESLTMLDNVAYLSIETNTPSAYCYLIRGTVDDAAARITLDLAYLVPLPKPAPTNGIHVHNAGFESLVGYNQRVLALFEYNYFGRDNYAFAVPTTVSGEVPRYVPVARLPFRITDMVYEGQDRFTAINYFYKGDEEDVYRPAATDANAKLVQDGTGYKNYCRLISLEYKKDRLTWKPVFELPAEYMTYNWEGLAAYKQGYFLINDKYGPSNQSTLLYLQKQ